MAPGCPSLLLCVVHTLIAMLMSCSTLALCMELVRNTHTIRLSCAVWRSYGAAHSGLLERLLRELLYRGILGVGGI